MRVVLLRVGIDTGAESGGILGPLYSDGSFEFIPIKDGFNLDERTYGNTRGRHGKLLSEYFPAQMRERMRDQSMHVDPEFVTFTYGDPTTPKAGLRALTPGDLLVFYAGLRGHDFPSLPALYIIGYFEVALAGRATNFDAATIETRFAANYHVRHPSVFAEQRERLLLVKGAAGSKLLDRAIKISEDGKDVKGMRIHVLSHEMRGVFGDFSGRVAIQRSPPRWVESPHVDSAAAFVRSLR